MVIDKKTQLRYILFTISVFIPSCFIDILHDINIYSILLYPECHGETHFSVHKDDSRKNVFSILKVEIIIWDALKQNDDCKTSQAAQVWMTGNK